MTLADLGNIGEFIGSLAMYMGRDRYMPAGSYDAFISAAVVLTCYGAAPWWENAKATFARDFVELIESERAKMPNPPRIWEILPTFMYVHQGMEEDA